MYANRYPQQSRVAKPVVRDATQQPLVDAMRAAIPQMGPRDAAFAGDLSHQFQARGRLSDKQMYWVETLTQRATAAKPAAQVTQQVSVAKINEMFEQAGQTLKRVRVRLQTAEGQPVVFARAGKASKYAGQVMITDGGPFGQNKYFGRIDAEGQYFGTRHADEQVLALVQEFADKPAETASKYGRLTGSCCFCSRVLTDKRSTQLGYGPICAQRFGLPH